MILSNIVIDDIKLKSGLLFDKAKDFETLAKLILEITRRSIGVTTLKRLLGYIDDDHRTNSYTLNTIALYLGYPTWDVYLLTHSVDSIWQFEDSAVYIKSLEENSEICIKYMDRVVRFKVIMYNEEKALKVIQSSNSSLLPNDVLYIYKIEKGKRLKAEKVFRGELIGNYKTSSELTSVEIMNSVDNEINNLS